MYQNTIPKIFDKIISLTVEEKEIISQYFIQRNYKRHQFILQEGDICKYYNFVMKGCLRVYKITEQGNINISQFIIENEWITDPNSFYHQHPSPFMIDALEDSNLLQISEENLYSLSKILPKTNLIFKVLAEKSFSRLQSYILKVIGEPSQKRYLYFQQEYPHLIGRIPQVQIASFLGITPECISRIKHNSSKKEKY